MPVTIDVHHHIHPYLRRDIAIRCARAMPQTAALSVPERQAVLHGNAQRLFPRLRERLAASSSHAGRWGRRDGEVPGRIVKRFEMAPDSFGSAALDAASL